VAATANHYIVLYVPAKPSDLCKIVVADYASYIGYYIAQDSAGGPYTAVKWTGQLDNHGRHDSAWVDTKTLFGTVWHKKTRTASQRKKNTIFTSIASN